MFNGTFNEVDQFFELGTGAKGANTFAMLQAITSVQALFPHINPEDVIMLYITAARQKISLDTLIPLSLAEQFGFRQTNEEAIELTTPSMDAIRKKIRDEKEKVLLFQGSILYLPINGKSIPYISSKNEKLDSRITSKKEYAKLKITKEFRSKILNNFSEKYKTDIVSAEKPKINEVPSPTNRGNVSVDFTKSQEETLSDLLMLATFLEQGATKEIYQDISARNAMIIKYKAIHYALKERLYALPSSPIEASLSSNFLFGETAEERKKFFIDTCNILKQVCLKLNFIEEIQTHYLLEKKFAQKKVTYTSSTSKEDWIKERKELVEKLLKEDPYDIYEAMGYLSRKSNDSCYMLCMDGEKTPNSSAYFKGGTWRLRDHTSGDNGTILNAIAKFKFGSFHALSSRYKECVDILIDYSNGVGIVKSNHAGRVNNDSSSSIKKVRVEINIPASESEEAKIYLASRGIEYIPNEFRYYKCYQESNSPDRDEDVVFGVGFINEIGGIDIRRLTDKLDPAHKVRNVGGKALVVFPPTNPDPKINVISPFESQFDLLAAMQYPAIREFLEKTHVTIANGAGMHERVVKYMEENDIQNAAFFNQNDNASQTMLTKILLSTPIRNFSKIIYEPSEKGFDINDLLKNNANLEERIAGPYIKRLLCANSKQFIDNSEDIPYNANTQRETSRLRHLS